jgi:hypothetical protein
MLILYMAVSILLNVTGSSILGDAAQVGLSESTEKLRNLQDLHEFMIIHLFLSFFLCVLLN